VFLDIYVLDLPPSAWRRHRHAVPDRGL